MWTTPYLSPCCNLMCETTQGDVNILSFPILNWILLYLMQWTNQIMNAESYLKWTQFVLKFLNNWHEVQIGHVIVFIGNSFKSSEAGPARDTAQHVVAIGPCSKNGSVPQHSPFCNARIYCLQDCTTWPGSAWFSHPCQHFRFGGRNSNSHPCRQLGFGISLYVAVISSKS